MKILNFNEDDTLLLVQRRESEGEFYTGGDLEGYLDEFYINHNTFLSYGPQEFHGTTIEEWIDIEYHFVHRYCRERMMFITDRKGNKKVAYEYQT